MVFADWIARSATPAALATAIRHLQQAAPEQVKTYFAMQPDGSFTLDSASFELRAA
jgi:hypothetical protein